MVQARQAARQADRQLVPGATVAANESRDNIGVAKHQPVLVLGEGVSEEVSEGVSGIGNSLGAELLHGSGVCMRLVVPWRG